jgi:hypothetical protein
MAKVPLDSSYRQALSEDRDEARSAVRLLQSATAYGRSEAGVFLMGLLVHAPTEDWEFRSAIVAALGDTHTPSCADLLFSELRRVKSSNTTRRYLGTVLKTLAHFPSELVREGLEALAHDKAFSPKMLAKFPAVAQWGPDGLR